VGRAHSTPIQPLASTREHAVVGVGGIHRPINDFVLPWERNVDIRGVDAEGNGRALVRFEVRVMVDGVCVVGAESGGNTNKVWEGVDGARCFIVAAGKETFRDLRKCGGDDGLRESVRIRGVFCCTEADAAAVIGDDGTGGRSPSGAGRRLPFKPRNGACDGMVKEDLVAELGGGGIWNEALKEGVGGGSPGVASARAVRGMNGVARNVLGRPSP